MTKLDEAIQAAAEAYFQEPCDDLDPELADNFCAAIQAAVKALVPEDQLYDDAVDAGRVPAPALLAIGWNNCRAEMLKNAGVMDRAKN